MRMSVGFALPAPFDGYRRTMPSPLEDYAIIGDLRTAAIVSRGGSIDWWAAPRFDSEACFCALVGSDDAGHWSIAPLAAVRTTERRYRDNSLVLETLFETEGGRVRVTDCVLIDCVQPTIVRTVVGLTGRVTLRSACHPRFYYGYLPASLRGSEGELYAIAGPDALVLRSSLAAHWEGKTAVSEFTVEHDESATFVLSWYPSHRKPPPPFDAAAYGRRPMRGGNAGRHAASMTDHGAKPSSVPAVAVRIRKLQTRARRQ